MSPPSSAGPDWAEFQSQLVLAAGCIAATGGPVLEVGSNELSSLLLHAACADRPLLTVEMDAGRLERVRFLESATHEFALIEGFEGLAAPEGGWDVALVHRLSWAARAAALRALRSRVRFLVVHGTDDGRRRGLEPLLSEFRYRADSRHEAPWATVVSDAAPVPVNLPDRGRHHVAVPLQGFTGARLETTGSGWTTVTLAEPVTLPPHFYLRTELAVQAAHPPLIQLLLETERPESVLWAPLVAPHSSEKPVTTTLAPAELRQVENAQLGDVRRLTLRARQPDGEPAVVEVRRVELLFLPADARRV